MQPEVRERLSLEIRRLMESPPAAENIPKEANEFALACDGLLIGWGWSFTALLPTGEIVDGSSLFEPSRDSSDASLFRTLGLASELYPTLAAFIPARPVGAIDCYYCNGSGKKVSIAGDPMRCPMCGGVCWILDERMEQAVSVLG